MGYTECSLFEEIQVVGVPILLFATFSRILVFFFLQRFLYGRKKRLCLHRIEGNGGSLSYETPNLYLMF